MTAIAYIVLLHLALPFLPLILLAAPQTITGPLAVVIGWLSNLPMLSTIGATITSAISPILLPVFNAIGITVTPVFTGIVVAVTPAFVFIGAILKRVYEKLSDKWDSKRLDRSVYDLSETRHTILNKKQLEELKMASASAAPDIVGSSSPQLVGIMRSFTSLPPVPKTGKEEMSSATESGSEATQSGSEEEPLERGEGKEKVTESSSNKTHPEAKPSKPITIVDSLLEFIKNMLILDNNSSQPSSNSSPSTGNSPTGTMRAPIQQHSAQIVPVVMPEKNDSGSTTVTNPNSPSVSPPTSIFSSGQSSLQSSPVVTLRERKSLDQQLPSIQNKIPVVNKDEEDDSDRTITHPTTPTETPPPSPFSSPVASPFSTPNGTLRGGEHITSSPSDVVLPGTSVSQLSKNVDQLDENKKNIFSSSNAYQANNNNTNTEIMFFTLKTEKSRENAERQ